MKNNAPQAPRPVQELVKDADFVIEAQKRISQLREVISWSFQNGGFSAGQRICIHQEIASYMKEIDAVMYEVEPENVYRLPQALQQKVQHVIQVIRHTEWKKQEFIKY